jgi:hypothetical protein
MDDGGGDGGRVKVRWTSVDALPEFVDRVMNPRGHLTGLASSRLSCKRSLLAAPTSTCSCKIFCLLSFWYQLLPVLLKESPY